MAADAKGEYPNPGFASGMTIAETEHNEGEPSEEEQAIQQRTAGENLEAGYEVVRRIKQHVSSTARPGSMGNIGSFGGMFDLSALGVREPVLVSGTDGVGTKLKIAFAMDKHDTIGIDAVAMCVNDVLAQLQEFCAWALMVMSMVTVFLTICAELRKSFSRPMRRSIFCQIVFFMPLLPYVPVLMSSHKSGEVNRQDCTSRAIVQKNRLF